MARLIAVQQLVTCGMAAAAVHTSADSALFCFDDDDDDDDEDDGDDDDGQPWCRSHGRAIRPTDAPKLGSVPTTDRGSARHHTQEVTAESGWCVYVYTSVSLNGSVFQDRTRETQSSIQPVKTPKLRRFIGLFSGFYKIFLD